MNEVRSNWLWMLGVVLIAVSGLYLYASGLHVRGSMFDMLPEGDQHGASVLREMARAGARQVNVLVRHADEKEARRQAEAILKSLPEELSPAMGQTTMQDLALHLQPYKFQLLSARHAKALQAGGEVAESVRDEALSNLYGFASLSLYPVDEEPYGFAATHLMESPLVRQSGFEPEGSMMTAQRDGVFYIYMPLILREDVASSFTKLDDVIGRLESVCGEDVLLAGTPVHTRQASRENSRTMALLSVVSGVVVVLLFICFFGSLRGLVLVFPTLGGGLLTALAVVQAIYGQVHMLSLVFGLSLIGISTDYIVHYLMSLSQSNSSAVSRGLRRSLLLGLGSSCLGYGMFYVTGWEMLGQIAAISIVGLSSVMLLLFAFYPPLFAGKVPMKWGVVCRYISGCRMMQWHVPGWLPWCVAVLLAVLAVGTMRTDDKITNLYTPAPHILEAEKTLAILNGMEKGVLTLMVEGENAEQLLQRQEELVETLSNAQVPCTAVCSVVPSEARQKHHFELVQAAAERWQDEVPLEEMPQWHGALTPDAFFAACPGFSYLASLWGEKSSVVLVSARYKEQLPVLPAHVQLTDRIGELENMLAQIRGHLMWLLGGILLLVPVGLSFHFGWGNTVRMLGPVVAGVLAIFALPGLVGEGVTLFHVLAAFLVIGLGFDYVIFRQSHRGEAHTSIAVLLSFITTMVTFGILVFTSFSVTHYIGTAISLGLVVIYLLSSAAAKGEK